LLAKLGDADVEAGQLQQCRWLALACFVLFLPWLALAYLKDDDDSLFCIAELFGFAFRQQPNKKNRKIDKCDASEALLILYQRLLKGKSDSMRSLCMRISSNLSLIYLCLIHASVATQAGQVTRGLEPLVFVHFQLGSNCYDFDPERNDARANACYLSNGSCRFDFKSKTKSRKSNATLSMRESLFHHGCQAPPPWTHQYDGLHSCCDLS